MIGIVVPVFNEEKHFSAEFFSQILELEDLHIVLVNDCSTDSSLDILLEFQGSNTRIHLLENAKNLGKANSVLTGIRYCQELKLTYFAFLDSDGAFDLQEIKETILKLKHTHEDVFCIWTSRVKLAGSQIERNWIRHYFGRILVTILTFDEKNIPYDTQCGFKLFKNNNYFEEIFAKKFRTRWLFDLEIYYRMKKLGIENTILELPLTHWKDVKGSKLTIKNFASIVREVFTILRIKKEH